ncbi:hypothetical protein FHT77_006367 [Rhizobium sp. BK181]|nr:hypothetical protein [Rhizobium sp. BK181]
MSIHAWYVLGGDLGSEPLAFVKDGTGKFDYACFSPDSGTNITKPLSPVALTEQNMESGGIPSKRQGLIRKKGPA